jgi:ribosomal protein S20
MPVTKTAKRALRGSFKKQKVNKSLISRLEIALRIAGKSKKDKDIRTAISLADRASKKKVIHANKAARIKSSLSKLLPYKKVKKANKPKSKK